ncbi:MAG TPA: putative Ig domain-containing protein, partial [Thermoanaerobaculia bacterium]|nr:putative Ig domain-containing protein [Thermoanaerobaculia bacterium]
MASQRTQSEGLTMRLASRSVRFGPLVLLASVALILLSEDSGLGKQLASAQTGPVEARVTERLSRVRIPFITNAGQIDPAVAYYAPTLAGTVYVTQNGQIVYSLPPDGEGSASGVRPALKKTRTSGERSGWSLTETAVAGKPRPKGNDPASTRVSYFLGNDPARWRSGLSTFEGVSLGEVWPGISLELRAHGKNIEKLFTVAPGGDPSRIRMSVAGARKLRVNEAGGLIVETGPGEVVFTPPEAFQERESVRHPVQAAYEVRGRQYGFQLRDYDPTLPVVIDPLLQATYLGGGGEDVGHALAVHPTSGDVYVAGRTDSTNFPGTAGGAQTAYGGLVDFFVARLNAALTTLSQATYLGGSSFEANSADIVALAIHPTSGDVYVAGETFSTDFPGTTGGAQAARGGSEDAFVARLNAALTTLNQATYLGGSDTDEALALAIHPASGDVYVAGDTLSTNFPGTAGGAQASNGGGLSDAFVARFNAALTTLGQATYLGGSGGGISVEGAQGLAIHPMSGDVYVAGLTDSTNFPGTAGGAQAASGGGNDGFVARLNAPLTTLSQATYLGGSDFDLSLDLAVHPTSGDVDVAGYTASTDFPGTFGGAQAANGGGGDAFAARFNAALTTLGQATYLGGSGGDFGRALVIHTASGDVYLAGATASTNFPGTAGGSQAATGGGADTFVARLNDALTTLGQATYLGGSSNDFGNALAIHPTSGDVYVAGVTASNSFPGMTSGAQAANGGGNDAFVARFSADLGAPVPAIVGTVGAGGSNNAVVFPSANTGLPTPVQTNVFGLPTNRQPHGVSYYGSDNALVSDFFRSRVFVVRISTASLESTIDTTGRYDGTGTIAVAPGLNFALASGLGAADPAPNTVAVIAAPFNSSSVVNTVPLPGRILSFQTQAIVFDPAGRAFVYHTTGISVLDPPYTAVAFTIPVSNPNSGAIAITAGGNTLLATDYSGTVRIYTAPFSVTSTATTLLVSDSPLDGIMVTPDGSKTLVVAAFGPRVSFISAPFDASSPVETIDLDARAGLDPGSFGGFEDVGISADGQLAILAGGSLTNPLIPFVRAPFSVAGSTVFAVNIPGGRGAGAVRFLPPGLAPGLTISKSAPASVQPGSTITYTITYGNTGTSSATNVLIRDPIPAGTSFVSATNGGVFDFESDVRWDIGTLNAGVTGQTVSFTVQVNATSGTINNVDYTIEGQGVSPIFGPPVSTTVTEGCPAITLSPSVLPGGSVGSSYSQSITASGGTAPYVFSVTSGLLPPGLSLSSGGVLSGTPTSGGSYSFTVTATDANQCSGSQSYAISISGCGAITVSPAVLFEGFIGVPYRRTISASGGTAPYSFSLTSGSLPPGLSLSGGVISGTPTAAGTYTFRIRAVDSNGCAGTQSYTLTISCRPVALSPAVLPPASQGVAYIQTITVLSGTGPYSFAV